MQYPLGQPLCPQSTKPRQGALLGLILLLIGLLPSLALAQGMPGGGGGAPLGGGGGGGGPAPSVPTTVTVDVPTSSTSSPGEPFTPPATNTPSPEAAALKKEADALKVIEDILPDSLKSKAPELLEKVRTGETKLEEIELVVQLHEAEKIETKVLEQIILDPADSAFTSVFRSCTKDEASLWGYDLCPNIIDD